MVSWGIVLGTIALSILQPLAAIALIIAFDLHWLLRMMHMNFFLALSYLKLWIEKETDWLERCRQLKTPHPATADLDFRQRLSWRWHKKALERLQRSGAPRIGFDEIYHAVLIPVARETRNVVEPGIRSVWESEFPAAQILIVLSVEESAGEAVKRDARALQEQYRSGLLDFLVTIHPGDIPGEKRVKGANATWAARCAGRFLRERSIDFDNVVASCFDADTVVSPEYFSCLSYHFLVSPNRLRASFQPIPVYNNNIWEAPAFARLLAAASTFFRLVEATNYDSSPTFSSHSISLRALIDIGYWPVDLVSDDSAVYWRAFLHFNAEYDVVPIYTTLSMDATQGQTWLRTVANVYRQRRRWAQGAELIPLVMKGFLENHRIPLRAKIKFSFRLWEHNVTLHLWPYLLTVAGWLPAFVAKLRYANSVASYNGPRITGTILGLSSFGFLIFVLIGQFLLPRDKARGGFLRRLPHALQWLLVPLVTLVFNTIPALDAHTRLMIGRRLEYWVTAKNRKLDQMRRGDGYYPTPS